MDISTNIFFVNLIAVFSVAMMDKHLFNESLIDDGFIGITYGIWVLLSLCSIPICLIYIVLL